ncbi:transketolase-like TK C-terminal-containing protein [Tepidimicrobium xylanilyticum]
MMEGISYEAANRLKDRGIGTKVVSMPSWEIFEE